MVKRFLILAVIATATLGIAFRIEGSAQTQPLRLIQTIPLPVAHGRIDHMDADPEGQRLFVAGLENGSMEVVDLRAGMDAQRSRLQKASGHRLRGDDVFFDEQRKRIYVIGAEGFISVFQQNDPDHYELVAPVPSAIGVRTGFFYAKRDRLYVGVPAKGNEPAQVWTFEAED